MPDSTALIRDLRDDEQASMIVVDASVAMKWFLNDQDSSQALGLFHQSYKLVAPELIRIEVLAAIDLAQNMASTRSSAAV